MGACEAVLVCVLLSRVNHCRGDGDPVGRVGTHLLRKKAFDYSIIQQRDSTPTGWLGDESHDILDTFASSFCSI